MDEPTKLRELARFGLGFLVLFSGWMLSLVAAVYAYWLLDMKYGEGGNSEGTATATQVYYSHLALPVSVPVLFGGIAISIWLSWLASRK